MSVINKIENKANVWSTTEEIVNAKNIRSTKHVFPGATDMIDCTHIRNPKFHGYGDEYVIMSSGGFTRGKSVMRDI